MFGGLWQAIKAIKNHKIAFAVSSFGFLAALVLTHLPHGPEHWSADLRTARLSDRDEGQYPNIVIVEVTESLVDQYPYASPINRKMLSDLITLIDQAGPRVIGLDFIFDRHTIPAEDQQLIATLHEAKSKIVLGVLDERSALPEARRDYQAEFLKQAHREAGHLYFGEGHNNGLMINADVVRTFAGEETHGGAHGEQHGAATKSFGELIAEAYGLPHAAPSPIARLGSLFISPSRYIAWLRPPRNGADTFTTISADLVLKARELKLPLADMLRDRIVLVGGRFLDRDLHLTPLSVTDGVHHPGITIHAQIIAQLLDGRSVQLIAWPLEWALLVVFFFVGLYAGYWSNTSHHWMEFAVLGVYLVATVVAFWLGKLIFPFVTVTLAFGMGYAGGHSAHGKPHGDVGHEHG